MAVLNSTVLRRSRAMELDNSKLGKDERNERRRRKKRMSVTEREGEKEN